MILPILPPELFDEILSQLSDETSTLKSCSLVCRSFRHRAQKMLFDFIFSVQLTAAERTSRQPPKLLALFKLAPQLIKYIQQLHILGSPRQLDDRKSTDLADALEICSRKAIYLRSLKIDSLSWHRISARLQDAIALLMTVHSIRDITLDCVNGFPSNLVQNLPPLVKSLSLKELAFPSLPITPKKPPKIESFTISTGFYVMRELGDFPGDAVERIADTSQLKTFDVGLCNPNSMPVIEQLLRPTYNSLEHLILQFDMITNPDSISIDLNHFPHLTDVIITHFCTFSYCLSDIPPVIIWITETMKNISHQNVLQSLSFRQVLGPYTDIVDYDLTLEDVWQELDTICSIPQLALSKSFRGITFIIEAAMPTCDAFEGIVRHRLPETTNASKLHIKTSYIEW